MIGLTLRFPRHAILVASAVFVVLASTTSRTIGLFDEGELAVAAYELGLGHPTGQPLHTLLGFVFAHLPGISPSYGLTLLSALATALSVIPVIALVERFLPGDARTFVAPVVVAALALHAIVWEPSTRIEVYPLATLFGLLAVAYATEPKPDSCKVACSLGLAASANPVLAAIAASCVGLVMTIPPDGRARFARRFLGGLAVGLVPYLYLGVAALRTHAFVWGGLTSSAELAQYISGRDYAGNLGADLDTRFAHSLEFLGYLLDRRAGAAVFATGVLGLAALGVRSIRAAAACVVAIVLPVAFVSSNRIFAVDVPDYLGYLGFGVMMLAVPVGAAVDAALRRSRLGMLLVVAIVGASVVSSPFLFGRTRAADDVTERLARIVLDEAPRGAIVVMESDHFVAPILYLQRVERVRPDVVVVIRGLMSSAWYLRMLSAQHPDLAEYAIDGRGARDGRIRRMIDANPARAVRLEHLGLGVALGLGVCPAGLTFATGPRCESHDGRIDLGPLVRTFSRAHRLPSGALDAGMIVPVVGLRLALDLERGGANRAAYTVLVASLPDAYRGTFLPPPSTIPDGRPLSTPNPTFARARALGEPARNAFVAARMLADAGQIDAAIELTRRAADDGLPEAIAVLTRAAAER